MGSLPLRLSGLFKNLLNGRCWLLSLILACMSLGFLLSPQKTPVSLAGHQLQCEMLFPGAPSWLCTGAPTEGRAGETEYRVSHGTGFGSKAPAAPAGPPDRHSADYLFYLDLSLVNQLSDHAAHRHHPRQHHYQREEEADVVQESARK